MAGDRAATRQTTGRRGGRSRTAAAAVFGLALWGASAAASCFAALVQPKAPPRSAYLLWMQETRPAIVKKLKNPKDATLVIKEAGVQWKKVTAAKKKTYQGQVDKQKKAFEAAKEKFLAAGGVMEVKVKREKKPPRDPSLPRDPNLPKRPSKSYMLWLNDNRKGLVAKLPAKDKKDVKAVAKAAGTAWKKVPKATKTKYEKQWAANKVKYEKAMTKYKADKEKA